MRIKLVVNPEQAKIVKEIYALYLQGFNFAGIAKMLTEEGHKTPFGKDTWSPSTVKSILSNEKYKGDALLQKGYLDSYLTKRYVKNSGEVQQYYVTGDHEAIIEPKIFDLVQEKMKEGIVKGQKQGVFSGKIRCGKCGGYFGAKVWHSTDKYRRVIYRCNKEYGGCGCHVRLTEEQIKDAFVEKVNKLIANKELTSEFTESVKKALDTKELEEKAKGLGQKIEREEAGINALVSENARKAMDQKLYNEMYEENVKTFL